MEFIDGINDCNVLITNMECYPEDENIYKIFNGEICWLSGKEVADLISEEDFQWVWGVFSVFDSDVELKEVLKCKLPYADGYKGFWNRELTLQNPLAKSEIAVWDGRLIIVISRDDLIINKLIEYDSRIIDLIDYNSDKN